MTATLYNPAILRLAAAIPHEGRLAAPGARVEKRSPVCGSRIALDVIVEDGRVTELAQEVRACALGQASAALMGAHAVGRTAPELETACLVLGDYLANRRDDPGGWPGLDIFAAAKAYPSRHAAILLPFEALAEAAILALPLPDLSPRDGLASAA